MSHRHKTSSLLVRQLLGQEPEPLWMSLTGGVIVFFILPALTVLYLVAFLPTGS